MFLLATPSFRLADSRCYQTEQQRWRELGKGFPRQQFSMEGTECWIPVLICPPRMGRSVGMLMAAGGRQVMPWHQNSGI